MRKLIISTRIFQLIGLFLQCIKIEAEAVTTDANHEAKYENLLNQVLGNFRDFSNDLLTIRTGLHNCTENQLKHAEIGIGKQFESLRLEMQIQIEKILSQSGLNSGSCSRQHRAVPVPLPNPDSTTTTTSTPTGRSIQGKSPNHLLLYRPGTGSAWILRNRNATFSPVYYSVGDPGNGIGGYDLSSLQDRAFAFDYGNTGRQDHVVLYRPGRGSISILRKDEDGKFQPVYQEGDPGSGILGYNLRSEADRIVPFDFAGSGKLDHLVLYRPGTGIIWIVKNLRGTFSHIYSKDNGIQGFDLYSLADRIIAFDYDHSGKMDHLVLYRPGRGAIVIVKMKSNSVVYSQKDFGSGIGGYDLKSGADRVLAFDYDHSGKQDHLVLYRPGTGFLWILKNDNGNFKALYGQINPGKGIGGYDLKSTADRIFSFDFDSSGLIDHLCIYRPGTGSITILKNDNGTFMPVYQQEYPGMGIGGYDLNSSLDRVLGFDY